jgi:hypothetical protein
MRTVETTRSGDSSVTGQLTEMRTWLDQAGITPLELEPLFILRARTRFRASFAKAEDADRFVARFDEQRPACN